MMQVGTNQSATYHSQPALSSSGGQTGRSSSTSRQQQQQQQQQQQPQYDNEQLANIRPRICILRKWPHYDGYGVHLARNQHWLGLRIGDVEPNSPAESGGLLREDVVLAVNGHSVENDDFFAILSFIQHELEADQIRFLVLDPQNADLARHNNLHIDENHRACVRMETPTLTVSPEKVLYDQWRATNNVDPTAAQNTVHLGPTLSLNPNQNIPNTQRNQQRSPNDRNDDVYTFLPYSDRALENGKSFFEILFEQNDHPSTKQEKDQREGDQENEQQQHPRHTTYDPSNKHFTGDNDNSGDHKDKTHGSQIKDGIKNIAKAGIDNLKSILPTKTHDDNDSKHKPSSGSIDHASSRDDSPTFIDKVKDKLKPSSHSPTNTPKQQKQSQPYENMWQSSSQSPQQDTNNNLNDEQPRLCSLHLRSGDTIGISLQPDNDFSHIIKQVEPNSPAGRAGIEKDDCIITLNDIPLLRVSYEEVLNTLKKSRDEPDLDFLVAKKSYLLKSRKDKTAVGEVLPSSNLPDRNSSSTIPPAQALEQLYDKYNKDKKPSFDEQKNSNKSRETVSTSTPNNRYDPNSSDSDNNRYPSKPQQGQILHGVGPATADQSSWGGKSSDDFRVPASGDSSTRSTSRDRRPDADDIKGRNSSVEDSFKPLQVGITNPTATQQASGNVSPNLVDDRQRGGRPTSYDQRDNSTGALPSPGTAAGASNRGDTTSSQPSRSNQTIQNISNAVPILPDQGSSPRSDYDQGSSQNTPSTQSDARLGVTKAMSVPSKPPKSNVHTAVYSDSDDDDLSDISERSREEDISDPVVHKNLSSHATTTGATDNKINQLSADLSKEIIKSGLHSPEISSRASASGLRTSETSPNSTNQNSNFNKDLNEKRGLTSVNPNANQQSTTSPANVKTSGDGRTLERSDSDDTISDIPPIGSLTNPQQSVQARRLEKFASNESLSEAGKQNIVASPDMRTNVQARRLQKFASDDSISEAGKQPTSSARDMKPIVQARRLEQYASDDSISESEVPPIGSLTNTQQNVQARRLEKYASDDSISEAGRQPTVKARRLEKSDSDDSVSTANIPPIASLTNNQPNVQARRLDKSDSDDNISGAESQATKQSAADTFYSPVESVDDATDTEEQPADSWQQRVKKEINQIRTPDNKQTLSQARTQDESDDDDDDRSSSEESESQKTPLPRGKMAFATLPLSELKDYGYDLHDIQLMQPTETSPVGLKLTKQHDPLQYIITAVAKGTKADLAGLKVNDWLIKVEDKDVRLVEFAEVSQDIRQLLTNAGLINMVVARKKSPTSSPTIKPTEQQRSPLPSTLSKPESISRQQGGQIPASLLTTDITRDTPDNNQVRFIPDKSQHSPPTHSPRSPVSTHVNAPGGPLSVGITNPISDENQTRSPRSQSQSPRHSPTRAFTVNRQQEASLTDEPSDEIDPNDIRKIELKEALGLDFNSFIPEGDSKIQTHFISNVQPSSMADKAGLRDGDRILTVNGYDVKNAIHEDVRRMMQGKKPLQLTVVNDPKYLELIENVKRNQPKGEGTEDNSNTLPPDYETVEQEKSGGGVSDVTNRNRSTGKSVTSDSGSDSNVVRSKPGSPKSINDDLSKHSNALFVDDKGPVQGKHCILKKDPSYNGYGLLLRYQNGLHLIDQVEENSPAYNCGLREDDVIIFVDKRNVEQMTHDDVKILIRKLSLSNTNIDLILLRKNDMGRYKTYQEKNSVNWQPLLQDKLYHEIQQTEQHDTDNSRSIDDPVSVPRKQSATSSSGKQQAPAPPTSSATTRVCTLYPSAERTAGFALSGKAPPPYVICQIEKNSPAEKAGLLINDTLLSINGKSVTDISYEETVKLIKEALQQKSVELVVRDQANDNKQDQKNIKVERQSTTSDQRYNSMGSSDSNALGNLGNSGGGEAGGRDANTVEQYQKQRNKELSYTLRLCHLHPTNGDGTQAATFGFELSEEPDYEYPLILRVKPQSPAEGAGLQSRDILLKINERKTKGLGYEKAKKEIEKAKRDGRLEMLVVDQETFDYCKRSKKPLKEPEMKVKHIFPKSRSSASFHKLPVAGATSSSLSSREDSGEQLSNSITKQDDNNPYSHRTSDAYRLSVSKETDSENEDEKPNLSREKSSPEISSQPKTARNSEAPVKFDLTTPTNVTTDQHHHNEQPLKFRNRDEVTAQRTSDSSVTNQNAPNLSRSATSLQQKSAKDSKGSKAKAIPHAINNLFHRIGHSKSSKPDYDTSIRPTVSSKGRAPSPPSSRIEHNHFDSPYVSQSLDTVINNPNTTVPASSIQDTVRSTVSTGSFDYLRGPRRCVLKVDRNKGLGFVLSATGDFDHTITAVEKYSAADAAGLQINDEVLEVDGVDVRTVKYEQVVEMLVSAMRTNDTIDMRVIDGRSRDVYPSTTDVDKQTNTNHVLNSNNNNNTITGSTTHSQRTTAVLGDDISDINSSISIFDSLNQQKIATSYPNLPGQLKHFDNFTSRALSGSVPALATGITASPGALHHAKSISTSSEKGSITRLSDISSQDAPVARLCRVRKFASSPFYGFFLCGDPKKLGRVFISDVTKHSPAAVCGLRDGDRIIEINGLTIHTLTYETILDKIKQHMARDDLELLVLDKKSVHWYRERNYPITSRTLPTIVHIEPIINDTTSDIQSSELPSTHTKMVGFADRRVSKTGL
ncbi:unnamed protein product [Adineta steineri]|uniref:PDZ domain-containing protein n=1 Tax=Adineta steineri TaxID=433720 RepID=A0A813W404_9BILA|nr:unnamed protein product [Adineta steineri]